MVRMQTQGRLRILDTKVPGERDPEPRNADPEQPTPDQAQSEPEALHVSTPQQSHPTAVTAAPSV